MKVLVLFLLLSSCCFITTSYSFKGRGGSSSCSIKFSKSRDISLKMQTSKKGQINGLLVGSAGLITLLMNRLLTGLEAVADGQSRADLIGVVATSGVLLEWLSNQEIERRERDPVPLAGYALKTTEISSNVREAVYPIIKWLTDSILAINFITSVHVILDDTFIARSGVVGYDDRNTIYDFTKLPILSSVISSRKQVYLPDLQILPGKVEFSYLPLNCQSVLILPMKDLKNGVVVIGTNKAKSFDFKDIQKVSGCIDLFESEYTNRLRWNR